MKTFNTMSWEEIYKYWDLYSMHGPSALNMPISLIEIHVDFCKQNGVFYGYDWLSRSEYESRKSTIENNVAQFLFFTTSTNKGTIAHA